MGQCCSAPQTNHHGPDSSNAPEGGGLVDRVVRNFQASSGGLQLAVSQARLTVSAAADATPALVQRTSRGVLVALFEGLGQDRCSVAAYCRSRVAELFQECSVCHPDSPLEALKQTLTRLDAEIFATDRLKHATKVHSGASAVLLLLELDSTRVYCANVGATLCLLGRISGSFNAKTPEGFFLTAEHTTRNREELVRLQRRAPQEASPAPASARGTGSGGAAAVEHTRALGFMEAKQQAGKAAECTHSHCLSHSVWAHAAGSGIAAGGSGALVCEASATDHALTGADQHLVLGSSAFWELVGPTDCALRAHFHEKFARQELERAAAVAAAAAAAGAEELPSPALLQAANTAEHLVYWSLEKAARKLARMQPQRAQQGGGSATGAALLPPSVADLMALPLERPPAPPACACAPGQEAAAADGEAGAAGQAEQAQQAQAQQAQRQILRSDVHGDLGVVVITLRRQDHSVEGGMRQVLMAARATQAAAAAGGGYVERLAARRWNQVRMLVDFYKAHRRVLLRQWWDAQDALFRRSRVSGAGAARMGLLGSLGNSPGKLAAAAAAKANAGGSVGKKPAAGAAPGAAAGIKAVWPGSARK